MNTLTHHPLASIPKRLAIGTLILIAFVILGIAVSHAGAIPPTVYYGSEHVLAVVSAVDANTGSAAERRGAKTPDHAVVVNAPANVVERPETLPQTASYQPWIALMAIISLVAAALLASGRLLQAARSGS